MREHPASAILKKRVLLGRLCDLECVSEEKAVTTSGSGVLLLSKV